MVYKIGIVIIISLINICMETKLTKKGKPDKRAASSRKNIKSALVTREKIVQEYNETKGKKKEEEKQPIEDPKSESSSSYESDSSTEEIIIQKRRGGSKKNTTSKESVPNQNDEKIRKLEELVNRLNDKIVTPKEEKIVEKDKPIEKEKPVEPVTKKVSIFDNALQQHMKHKILNFD
jgi:hypothetical protein